MPERELCQLDLGFLMILWHMQLGHYAVTARLRATISSWVNVGNLVESHLLIANSRYRNRHLLCFLDVGFKQSCEALQLFRISELHELHFALSNGCGINRFREARVVNNTGWRLTPPGRPRCDGLFQNVGCDRHSSTCRHVKPIHAQEPGCQSHPTPGGPFQAFVHQP